MKLFLSIKRSDGSLILQGEEAHHCIRVLRYSLDDQIDTIDGKGNKYLCRIDSASKKEVALTVLQKETDWGEPPYNLLLGISPLRLRDRFETAIEKSIELGVSGIVPLQCSRTVKKGLKTERLHKIAISAIKQCKRSRIPAISNLEKLDHYIAEDTSH
jgi:16S rRNA (uracil1498-N3)-methyltransferase